MRVVVGLSGGVDSAVAAARLLDAGHDVTGVHLRLAHGVSGSGGAPAAPAAPAGEAHDAAEVAQSLGVPFEAWDLREDFDREVVAPFVAEYAAGRTPNPCLRCNERVKFASLLERAVAGGFDAVASGHYARLLNAAGGGRELHRGVDPAKDQAYVLAVLDAAALARCLFPLGASTKAQVRAEAAARGLPVASKGDSLDVCFIPGGDTRGFLARRAESRPGPIVDLDGGAVGSHAGALGFTVGQRRGLALRRPAADGLPRYVVAVRPQDGTVVVGPGSALAVHRLTGSHMRLPGGAAPRVGDRVGVQVRAHGDELPGEVLAVPPGPPSGLDGPLEVRLLRPARGVACGQTMVLYDGTRVVASATIDATAPSSGVAEPQLGDPAPLSTRWS